METEASEENIIIIEAAATDNGEEVGAASNTTAVPTLLPLQPGSNDSVKAIADHSYIRTKARKKQMKVPPVISICPTSSTGWEVAGQHSPGEHSASSSGVQSVFQSEHGKLVLEATSASDEAFAVYLNEDRNDCQEDVQSDLAVEAESSETLRQSNVVPSGVIVPNVNNTKFNPSHCAPSVLKVESQRNILECPGCKCKFLDLTQYILHFERDVGKLFQMHCVKCDKMFYSQNKCQMACHLKQHLDQNYTALKDNRLEFPLFIFKCLLCNVTFCSSVRFERHMLKIKDSRRLSKCLFCNQIVTYMNECEKYQHETTHEKAVETFNQLMKDNLDSLQFDRKPDKAEQIEMAKCKGYTEQQALSLYDGTMDLKEHKCTECLFNAKTSIVSHLLRQKSFDYQCHICGLTMMSLCSFFAHNKLHQIESKELIKSEPFMCPECGMKFMGSWRIFIKHVLEECFHGVKVCRLSCVLCQKNAYNSVLLARHMESHIMEFFHCVYCKQGFARMKNLIKHNRLKHRFAVSQVETASLRHCLHCPETLTSKKEEVDHIQKHVEKSKSKAVFEYVCLECNGTAFENRATLIKHRLDNHPNGHYCKTCCKAFFSFERFLGHVSELHPQLVSLQPVKAEPEEQQTTPGLVQEAEFTIEIDNAMMENTCTSDDPSTTSTQVSNTVSLEDTLSERNDVVDLLDEVCDLEIKVENADTLEGHDTVNALDEMGDQGIKVENPDTLEEHDTVNALDEVCDQGIKVGKDDTLEGHDAVNELDEIGAQGIKVENPDTLEVFVVTGNIHMSSTSGKQTSGNSTVRGKSDAILEDKSLTTSSNYAAENVFFKGLKSPDSQSSKPSTIVNNSASVLAIPKHESQDTSSISIAINGERKESEITPPGFKSIESNPSQERRLKVVLLNTPFKQTESSTKQKQSNTHKRGELVIGLVPVTEKKVKKPYISLSNPVATPDPIPSSSVLTEESASVSAKSKSDVVHKTPPTKRRKIQEPFNSYSTIDQETGKRLEYGFCHECSAEYEREYKSFHKCVLANTVLSEDVGSLCESRTFEGMTQCAHCLQQFYSSCLLKDHMYSQTRASLPLLTCSFCSAVLQNKCALKSHMNMHRISLNFSSTCPECGVLFTNQKQLKKHVVEKCLHNNRRACIKCTLCLNNIPLFDYFEHVSKGHCWNGACLWCGKYLSGEIRDHYKAHLDALTMNHITLRFFCHLCPDRNMHHFSDVDGLFNHLSTDHDKMEKKKVNTKPKGEKRVYKCPTTVEYVSGSELLEGSGLQEMAEEQEHVAKDHFTTDSAIVTNDLQEPSIDSSSTPVPTAEFNESQIDVTHVPFTNLDDLPNDAAHAKCTDLDESPSDAMLTSPVLVKDEPIADDQVESAICKDALINFAKASIANVKVKPNEDAELKETPEVVHLTYSGGAQITCDQLKEAPDDDVKVTSAYLKQTLINDDTILDHDTSVHTEEEPNDVTKISSLQEEESINVAAVSSSSDAIRTFSANLQEKKMYVPGNISTDLNQNPNAAADVSSLEKEEPESAHLEGELQSINSDELVRNQKMESVQKISVVGTLAQKVMDGSLPIPVIKIKRIYDGTFFTCTLCENKKYRYVKWMMRHYKKFHSELLINSTPEKDLQDKVDIHRECYSGSLVDSLPSSPVVLSSSKAMSHVASNLSSVITFNSFSNSTVPKCVAEASSGTNSNYGKIIPHDSSACLSNQNPTSVTQSTSNVSSGSLPKLQETPRVNGQEHAVMMKRTNPIIVPQGLLRRAPPKLQIGPRTDSQDHIPMSNRINPIRVPSFMLRAPPKLQKAPNVVIQENTNREGINSNLVPPVLLQRGPPQLQIAPRTDIQEHVANVKLTNPIVVQPTDLQRAPTHQQISPRTDIQEHVANVKQTNPIVVQPTDLQRATRQMQIASKTDIQEHSANIRGIRPIVVQPTDLQRAPTHQQIAPRTNIQEHVANVKRTNPIVVRPTDFQRATRQLHIAPKTDIQEHSANIRGINPIVFRPTLLERAPRQLQIAPKDHTHCIARVMVTNPNVVQPSSNLSPKGPPKLQEAGRISGQEQTAISQSINKSLKRNEACPPLRKVQKTNTETHSCQFCGYTSDTRGDILVHISLQHSGFLPALFCPICEETNIDATFSETCDLIDHLTRNHQEVEREKDDENCYYYFICYLCNSNAQDLASFIKHIVEDCTRSGTKERCPWCQYKGISGHDLQTHIHAEHRVLIEKYYRCQGKMCRVIYPCGNRTYQIQKSRYMEGTDEASQEKNEEKGHIFIRNDIIKRRDLSFRKVARIPSTQPNTIQEHENSQEVSVILPYSDKSQQLDQVLIKDSSDPEITNAGDLSYSDKSQQSDQVIIEDSSDPEITIVGDLSYSDKSQQPNQVTIKDL